MAALRRSTGILALLLTVLLSGAAAGAQERTPVDRAKDVFNLLNKEDFKALIPQFDAKMTAALSEEQMRNVWASVGQQAGTFTSFVDDRVATPAPGMTVVVLGCQFEKAIANVTVAFDADGKIAGLSINPRRP